jgi:hypothetical protein
MKLRELGLSLLWKSMKDLELVVVHLLPEIPSQISEKIIKGKTERGSQIL